MACTYKKVDSLEKSGYGEPLSIDRTFIRPLVASLQLPDEHLQFLSSAPPVFQFAAGTDLYWICH